MSAYVAHIALDHIPDTARNDSARLGPFPTSANFRHIRINFRHQPLPGLVLSYSHRQWNTRIFHSVRSLNAQHRERNTIVAIIGTSASTQTGHHSYDPYRVCVEEYVNFHKQGFLLVRSLVRREEVQELIDHMDNLLAGREPIPGIAMPSSR